MGWVPDKEQCDHSVGKAQTQGIWVQGQQPRGAQVSNQLASGRPVNKGKVLSLSWAQIPVKSDRRAGLPEMHDMETEGVWREGALEISLLLGMALWLQARILESSFFKQTAH